ncbi:putative transcriptional regulator, Fur family [Aeropyrum pernix]|uniref:Putative transcriptional regulator, Fur family n=1 Tax=Aeropyrum pernix TaxID=56636 RepID=A0A401H9R6_AERPX|nr:putative transcriptional regulator, Fur family [Aeropyrum pernix]
MDAVDDGQLYQVLSMIRKRGMRLTPQRVALVKYVLVNVEKHESLREIHEKISREMPGISVSTVYHTLKMLEELGFIKTFEINGKIHIDRPHFHVNLHCLDTGKITDVDVDLGGIAEKLGMSGLKIRNIIVEVENCGKSGEEG